MRTPNGRQACAAAAKLSRTSGWALSLTSMDSWRAASGAARRRAATSATKSGADSDCCAACTARGLPSCAMAASASSTARRSTCGSSRLRLAKASQRAAAWYSPPGESCTRIGHSRWMGTPSRSNTPNSARRTRPSSSAAAICSRQARAPAASATKSPSCVTATPSPASALASAASAAASAAPLLPWPRPSTPPTTASAPPERKAGSAASAVRSDSAVSRATPCTGRHSAKSLPFRRPAKVPGTRST